MAAISIKIKQQTKKFPFQVIFQITDHSTIRLLLNIDHQTNQLFRPPWYSRPLLFKSIFILKILRAINAYLVQEICNCVRIQPEKKKMVVLGFAGSQILKRKSSMLLGFHCQPNSTIVTSFRMQFETKAKWYYNSISPALPLTERRFK